MAAAAAAAHACVLLPVSQAALVFAGLRHTACLVFHILWWQPEAAVTESKSRGAAQGACLELPRLLLWRSNTWVFLCSSASQSSCLWDFVPSGGGRAWPLPLPLAAVKNVFACRACAAPALVNHQAASQPSCVSAHWCLVLLSHQTF